jgi:isoleucyl-tRNA synthetase
VTLHETTNGSLLSVDVKPNLKSLGSKLKDRLKEVQTALAAMEQSELARLAQSGAPFELSLPGGPVTLEPTDLWVTTKAPDGWAGVADRGTQVAIDARLTAELKREGMARDVVRQVQELRKHSNLEMEDRIALYLGTDSPELRAAIEEHRETIAAETLTVQWSEQPLGDGSFSANVKVDGQPLVIQLRKV